MCERSDALLDAMAAHRVVYRQPLPADAEAALLDLPPAVRDLVTRIVVAQALLTASERELTVRLPAQVGEHYEFERKRIVDRLIRSKGGDGADLATDTWRKELLIAAGGLLPIGAGFMDVTSGVPRGYLIRGGLRQFVRAAWAIMKARGRAPFVELHAHTESMGAFSAQGWMSSYRVLAELLLLNPHLRGVIRANWFIDPRIAEISPHLAYTREVPAKHGAVFLFVEIDRCGSSGALAKSARGRALFERGEYVPRIYMMIWPRADLLRGFQTSA